MATGARGTVLRRIAIIGGGISGLVGAWGLHHHPDRFEAADHAEQSYRTVRREAGQLRDHLHHAQPAARSHVQYESQNEGSLSSMVGQRGLEPRTSVLSGLRSNRLSYWPLKMAPLRRTPPPRPPHTRRRSRPARCEPRSTPSTRTRCRSPADGPCPEARI